MMTDLNSGAFTAGLQSARTIEIGHHRTRVGSHVFSNIEMHEMLAELPRRAIRCSMTCSLHAGSLGHIVRDGDDPISADALYSRWEKFSQPGDTIIAETGTASMGLAFAHLPRGATFHNQTIWGSIGWATPASFDAAVAIRRHSHVLGCQDWYTARVTTCAELDQAMKVAGGGDTAAYIEVITDTYAAPPLAQRLHDSQKTFYGA